MRRRATLHYVARQRNNFDKMSTVSSLEGESRKPKGAVLFTGNFNNKSNSTCKICHWDIQWFVIQFIITFHRARWHWWLQSDCWKSVLHWTWINVPRSFKWHTVLVSSSTGIKIQYSRLFYTYFRVSLIQLQGVLKLEKLVGGFLVM